MKNSTLARGAALAALLVGASQYAAAGNISGSKHDFSTTGWSNDRICVACHAPHHADISVSDAPLWNHELSGTATYTLYNDGGTSSTLNATMGQPSGLSKLCLSCHDGTVAVDSFGGTTGTGAGAGGPITSRSNLGVSLSDDHPIGFTYDTALATADGSLWDPADGAGHPVTIGSGGQTKEGSIAAVMLYDGKVECSSCHDVHNTFTADSGAMLVKVTQSGSQICLACHNK